MRWYLALILLLPSVARAKFILVCNDDNDLLHALPAEQSLRAASPDEAIRMAGGDDAVLILADGYPTRTTRLSDEFLKSASDNKKLRMYIEYAGGIDGIDANDVRTTTWERGVVSSDLFGSFLPKGRIVAVNDCHYLPAAAHVPHLAIARVAGYDTAVYGIPPGSFVLLYGSHGNWIVGTTKLSSFVTARYAPLSDWKLIWRTILARLDPHGRPPTLNVVPTVHPALSATQPAPSTLERDTFDSAARFYTHARLFITKQREPEIHRLLAANKELSDAPATDEEGDGSLGMLEGYASQIRFDGTQPQRTPIRADCNAEAAMVLSLADEKSQKVAANLLDYTFSPAMQTLGRLDPKHPAFGLIGWGAVSHNWMIANYGDDNARVILGAILASAALKTDRWDTQILRALCANLRTTGNMGFRGDRIDVTDLEKNGWLHYRSGANVNFSPHFESYLWACYLWAYRATGDTEFLTRPSNGISMTMRAYELKQWRWMDNIERARMLLCLAWLVHVDDTPQHRRWIATIAKDLLDAQQECGAIAERFGNSPSGHFEVPKSNEAYGTTETPLIQQNGDPVSDQLYTTGFALFALHEINAAISDARLKKSEDQLADYLCRIQVRSEKHKELDGGWFRAFDFKRWDYWASSADAGWGAWSCEAGWGPAWTAAALALRQRQTTFWDLTATSQMKTKLEQVRAEMAQNDGSPLKR